MASLHALLPADRARAVMSRLDKAARHLRAAPDEERTLAQLRADAFADLITMTDAPAVSSTTSARNAAATAWPRTQPPHPPAPTGLAPEAPRTFRSAPPATVIVTVPALTLLGHDAEPATLEGTDR